MLIMGKTSRRPLGSSQIETHTTTLPTTQVTPEGAMRAIKGNHRNKGGMRMRGNGSLLGGYPLKVDQAVTIF